jgi:hypothetical protein
MVGRGREPQHLDILTHLHGQRVCKEEQMPPTSSDTPSLDHVQLPYCVHKTLTPLFRWGEVWRHGRTQSEARGEGVELCRAGISARPGQVLV